MSGLASPFSTPPGRRVTVAVDITAVGRMSGIRRLECVAAYGRYFFEGDILVTPMRVSAGVIETRSIVFGNRITNSAKLWKDGVVAYACHPALADVVAKAIALWEHSTPVRFKPYKHERAYVVFMPGQLNASAVGCVGEAQMVTLRKDATVATAIHEIGHVLGLWHEHGRSDRDLHVLIHRQNILTGQGYQFDQVIKDAQDFGAYDIRSIMHYDSFAFSANDQQTITARNGSLIPQNADLSQGDILTITSMYA